MSPEERKLLDETLRLARDNNHMLRGVRRHMHWSVMWGFCKFLLIAVPLAIGFFYVKDNLGNQSAGLLNQTKELIDSLR